MGGTAPAGGICAGRPCWKAVGASGFRYHDKDATPDGLTGIVLKSGDAGQAKVVLKAKGVALGLPPLPLSLPVRVSLHAADGTCWESVYGSQGVIQNDERAFKAKDE